MANYINPINLPDAFLTSPPIVMVVRHVRIMASGEVVIEDANALPRHLMRIDAHRVFPRPVFDAPKERNIPDHGTRKKL